MKKIISLLMLFAFTICMLAGCGSRQIAEGQKEYNIYCLDRDENTLKSYSWYSDKTGTDLIDEMIVQMETAPEDVKCRETIRGFGIENYAVNGNQLTIELDEGYHAMQPTTEILVRAALVRNLCQVDGVDYIMLRCHGEDLLDALGMPVGMLAESQFVDNAGNEINSYEMVKLVLFFADGDGEYLKKMTRTVEFNSNIALEKLVVEQIIAGPIGEESYPCVNSQTGINNVTVKDGICYVNFGNEFLSLPDGVKPEVAVYAIVNSLVELSNINKVSISVDGETEVLLGGELSLDTLFERNLEIIE